MQLEQLTTIERLLYACPIRTSCLAIPCIHLSVCLSVCLAVYCYYFLGTGNFVAKWYRKMLKIPNRQNAKKNLHTANQSCMVLQKWPSDVTCVESGIFA